MTVPLPCMVDLHRGCELRCARCVLRSGPLPTSIVLVVISSCFGVRAGGFLLPPPQALRRARRADRALLRSAAPTAVMPYVPPHRRQQAATGDAAVTSESSKSLQDLLQASESVPALPGPPPLLAIKDKPGRVRRDATR